MRTLGYVLGSMMLVRGAVNAVDPRLAFRWWEHSLRPHLPSNLNDMATEYSRLSDGTLRYLNLWIAMMGFVMLLLAARARD